MVVAVAQAPCENFTQSSAKQRSGHTHLVSGRNLPSTAKMIPQSEGPALYEDSYAGEPQFSSEDTSCGQSRCDKAQTALEVYQRILRRLERQEDTVKTPQNELKRQIWIASFTGGTIQYHC